MMPFLKIFISFRLAHIALFPKKPLLVYYFRPPFSLNLVARTTFGELQQDPYPFAWIFQLISRPSVGAPKGSINPKKQAAI